MAISAPRLDNLPFRVAALAPLSPGRDHLRSSLRARALDLVSPSAFIRLAKGRVTSPCSRRVSSISVSGFQRFSFSGGESAVKKAKTKK